MIEIIREFVVREEARGRFELAFGPGGAWNNLFGRCAGFRGTTVLRDTDNPRRYLIIELWDSAAQREQVLAERQAEYDSLNTALANLTESRTDVGTFRVQAEATVRPQRKAGQSRAGEARRRSR